MINNEREINSTVLLCDSYGRLNPDAVGWSRTPLHVCNIKRGKIRRHRWNCWIVLNEKYCFSAIISDLDYAGLIFVNFIDFESEKKMSKVFPTPLGIGVQMLEHVEADARFENKKIKVIMKHHTQGLRIIAETDDFEGERLEADINIVKPPELETLNVVVPWDDRRFQFTSKQNSMKAGGTVRIGDTEIKLDPSDTNAFLDFGRGRWPYSIEWNWAAFTVEQDGETIGMNLGGLWTDGTGSTENGICINGQLFKIGEEAVITFDKEDYMKPWMLETPETGAVSLELTPFYDNTSGMNLGILKSGVHQCFGHFNGAVNVGGREIFVQNALGWSEYVINRW